MRSLQTLGLTCIAAFGCTAMAAENQASPAPHPAAVGLAVDRTVSASLQTVANRSRYDRLRYLNSSLCVEQYGCTTSTAVAQSGEVSADYIDALNLGTYGPMKFKFTGDRVKLKVRF